MHDFRAMSVHVGDSARNARNAAKRAERMSACPFRPCRAIRLLLSTCHRAAVYTSEFRLCRSRCRRRCDASCRKRHTRGCETVHGTCRRADGVRHSEAAATNHDWCCGAGEADKRGDESCDVAERQSQHPTRNSDDDAVDHDAQNHTEHVNHLSDVSLLTRTSYRNVACVASKTQFYLRKHNPCTHMDPQRCQPSSLYIHDFRAISVRFLKWHIWN